MKSTKHITNYYCKIYNKKIACFVGFLWNSSQLTIFQYKKGIYWIRCEFSFNFPQYPNNIEFYEGN